MADGNNTTGSVDVKERVVLVIGATGAIGRRLVRALLERGVYRVVACLHRSPLPGEVTKGLPAATAELLTCEFGVDVRNQESLDRVMAKHAPSCVWNLAAPLSVDTAKDPDAARDVTVAGMERILKAMDAAGCSKICFTDSIGSFGSEAPREGATAAWLVAHPDQDPGSDYGRFKRGCRDAMARFERDRNFDCRWAIVPGVLHTDAQWGSGTTEYALDACKQFAAQPPQNIVFPLDPKTSLPMIHADDLTRGLIALQEAPASALSEPRKGYALAGFSFCPNDLFAFFRTLDAGVLPLKWN